jgi:hypothetical protein
MKNRSLAPHLAGFIAALFLANGTRAAEMLTNGDMELPVQTSNGNHYPLDPDGWTFVGGVSNLVRDPGKGVGGSDQYVDWTSGTGSIHYLRQSFTLAEDSIVDFGAYFSNRGTANGGNGTQIYDATDTTMLYASPDVVAASGPPTWTLSKLTDVWLSAGTYVFRSDFDDYSNTDAAFVDANPNILVNGSFEDPVATNMNSNNLGTVPTGWNQTGADSKWNLVRVDGAGNYGGGPNSAQHGDQYIDIDGEFELFQNFTLTETSDLEFGAWFSNRELNNDNSPSTVGIYNAAGDTLLSPLASVNLFGQATPSTDWTLAKQTFNDLAPGTYQLRIDLNNYNNVDSAFVTVVPEPSAISLAALSFVGLIGFGRRRKP